MGNVAEIKEDILLLAKEIEDLKGFDTIALDLANECTWTGFFLISTCSSNAHLTGVLNEIRKLVYSMGYTINQNRKNHLENDWVLLDCGDFVIHLMNRESRLYYNLEERWINSEVIYSSSSKLS